MPGTREAVSGGRRRSGRPPWNPRGQGTGGSRCARDNRSAVASSDELLVEEPLDGATPCPRRPERLPDAHQLGVLLVQLVPEPPEGAASVEGAQQAARGALVGQPLGEVDHVVVPDPRRVGLDPDDHRLRLHLAVLVLLLEVPRARVHLACPRVEHPPVVVGLLVLQSVRKPVEVDGVRVDVQVWRHADESRRQGGPAGSAHGASPTTDEVLAKRRFRWKRRPRPSLGTSDRKAEACTDSQRPVEARSRTAAEPPLAPLGDGLGPGHHGVHRSHGQRDGVPALPGELREPALGLLIQGQQPARRTVEQRRARSVRTSSP